MGQEVTKTIKNARFINLRLSYNLDKILVIKYGISLILVWGYFCSEGPGYVCLIKSNMNKEDY